eukprot:15475837-Alexandrium_andersonii.AAC.1
MPILADSWVRLQGPATQRPNKSWYATRSVRFRVEGVVQAWASGRRERAEAAEPNIHVEAPDDGCRGEVEALLEAWTRQLPQEAARGGDDCGRERGSCGAGGLADRHRLQAVEAAGRLAPG